MTTLSEDESILWAALIEPSDDGMVVLRQDGSVYRAKDRGRNRVEVYFAGFAARKIYFRPGLPFLQLTANLLGILAWNPVRGL